MELLTPMLLIVTGLFLRFTRNEKLAAEGKRYWLTFIILGTVILILRIF